MSNISGVSGAENFESQPLKLKQLKKLDDVSIFNKFDTNNNKTISDSEIQKQGYIGKAFDKVKEYLTKRFGEEKIVNCTDENGYFQYGDSQEEAKIVKSLDELELRNGCCYDVRNCDITQLDLSKEQLLNLTIDNSTVMTSEQKAILEPYMENMKNPGLGIRNLHEQGITGKGVNMAIIDQPLGKHKEYSDNIIGKVQDINSEEMGRGWTEASLHGAAVTSIAVGKNTGVAPDAGLVYYSAVNLTKDPQEVKEYKERVRQEIENNKEESHYVQYLEKQLKYAEQFGSCSSNKPYVDAINKILDDNLKRPENERVSVISISWGFDELAPGYEELQQAIAKAKEQGVFIVSTALEEHYGMNTCGANRNPQADADKAESYEAGAFWKEDPRQMSDEEKNSYLLIPMDHRTVADYQDGSSYRYEGNDGGMSWSTPWLAGMYVLAKQANPQITPEKFWDAALKTSDECRNNDDNTYVGRIINPQKLIDEIKVGK